MNAILLYIFYPNPGKAAYSDPWVLAVLVGCAALVASSFAVRFWRGTLQSAVTKKLSKSWSSALFWFGVVGLVLMVSRVEKIQFVAMRFAWVLWALAFVLVLVVQWKMFRTRHYEIIPTVKTGDPRETYLPKRKK